MQQSSDITCHDIHVVCLICPWSWGGVLKAPTPRKSCASKHYSLRYGEHCVFFHNFCLFPSISVPSRSCSYCLCFLVDSLNRLALLAVCESPDWFQMWLTLATQLLLEIFSPLFIAPHVSPPPSHQLHGPPAASNLWSTFPSVPLPPLLLFSFVFWESKTHVLFHFLMSRLVYDSGWILYCWLSPAPCIRNPCGPIGFFFFLIHI